uniref:Uncharacterized protein n=1 Tax=Anguilla anguilla TaxID=7936 RepID=A0A0E9XK69_ANGAN
MGDTNSRLFQVSANTELCLPFQIVPCWQPLSCWSLLSTLQSAILESPLQFLHELIRCFLLACLPVWMSAGNTAREFGLHPKYILVVRSRFLGVLKHWRWESLLLEPVTYLVPFTNGFLRLHSLSLQGA